MAHLLVRHKVKDYAAWKPVFDDHAATRAAGGSKGGVVFRNADNPNEVLILMEWDGLDKARAFAKADELRKKMEEAGVVDQPDVYFLNEVDRPSK